MPVMRSLIPPPGNAARPAFLFLVAAFGLMLIGFPVAMYALGLGAATVVGSALLILAVAVGFLWFTVALARRLDRDAATLDAGEVWAEWIVPAREHRAFVADQRRATNRRAVASALGGSALGIVLAWLADDPMLGGILIGAFLLAGLLTFFFAGPPRRADSDAARHVRIGPRGMHVLGRYVPFETTLTRLRHVQIEDGDPPVLRFTVKAGRRFDELRAPIPPDRLQHAQALVERLRLTHGLQTPHARSG